MVRKNNRFQFQASSSTERDNQTVEEDSKNVAEINCRNQLQNQVENPGLILVNTVLTSNNFLPWSRAVKRALIAKEKLRFIVEDDLKPKKNTPAYNL